MDFGLATLHSIEQEKNVARGKSPQEPPGRFLGFWSPKRGLCQNMSSACEILPDKKHNIYIYVYVYIYICMLFWFVFVLKHTHRKKEQQAHRGQIPLGRGGGQKGVLHKSSN